MQLEPVDDETRAWVQELGEGLYGYPCRVRGELVCIGQMIYTYGIIVGLDQHDYRVRYCYPNIGAALVALAEWGAGDAEEPSGFIKRK